MTLQAALRTLGWIAGTLVPQQAIRALLGRDFNAALGRVDDALTVAEEQVEVWEPRRPVRLPVELDTPAGLAAVLRHHGVAVEFSDQPPASDFPDCNCAAHQAADLDDHRPACAARAADSPAVGERTPDNRPTAGRTFGQAERDQYFAGLTWPEPKVDPVAPSRYTQIHHVSVLLDEWLAGGGSSTDVSARIVDMLAADKRGAERLDGAK